MKYKLIELNSYPRRSHFEYFSAMSNPYVGVTVEVDITDFLRTVKRTKSPFFLSFLYCVVRAQIRFPSLDNGSSTVSLSNMIIVFHPTLSWERTVHTDIVALTVCRISINISPRRYLSIVWGKYTENDKSRVSVPVTLLANHALVDGIHLARFYDELNVQLGTLTDILSTLNPIPSSLTQPF